MRVQAKHSPLPLWGRGARGEGATEIRSRKSEIRTALYSRPILTSDFCFLTSGAPPHPRSLSPRGGEGRKCGGTPPPSFCNSNATAPADPQDVDAVRRHPSHFPKVRMGTLGSRLLPREARDGDRRAQRDGGGGERRGTSAPLPASRLRQGFGRSNAKSGEAAEQRRRIGGTPPALRGESHFVLCGSASPRENPPFSHRSRTRPMTASPTRGEAERRIFGGLS